MVKVENSRLFPKHDSWQSPNFICMSTSIEPVQPGCRPVFVSCDMYTNTMASSIAVPSIPSLRMPQIYGGQGLPQTTPLPHPNLLPAVGGFLKESQPTFVSGLTGEAALNGVPECQRKFLVFDQSGNETRLMYSSFFPTSVKPVVADEKPAGRYFHFDKRETKAEQIDDLTVPKLQDVSNENQLSGKESEMHEDTEEINALLYSDDDDDDSDDDEVKSTGHSPTLITGYMFRGQLEEITHEVAVTSSRNKRQKVLDGGYKRSSLTNTVSPTEVAGLCSYNSNDAESNFDIGRNQEEARFAFLSRQQPQKDKVLALMKILESMIPGAKDKDPLMVLDVAIDYLKSLKLEAETLGVKYG